jgi:hypothetical protein
MGHVAVRLDGLRSGEWWVGMPLCSGAQPGASQSSIARCCGLRFTFFPPHLPESRPAPPYAADPTALHTITSFKRGYFLSKNCMREVVATLAQEKDYLFVREADQAKGGGSLASLKEELNNTKTRDKLFETAGAPLCGTV